MSIAMHVPNEPVTYSAIEPEHKRSRIGVVTSGKEPEPDKRHHKNGYILSYPYKKYQRLPS
jgi:hypothetical protein